MLFRDSAALSRHWETLAPPRVVGPAARAGGGVVAIPTSAGPLTVSLHPFGARFSFGGPRPVDYGLLQAPPDAEVVSVSDDETVVTIESATHRLALDKASLSFAFFHNGREVLRSATDGHFARARRLPPFARDEQGWYAHFNLSSDENIYGLGEKWGKLNKRGQLISSYNHDALGVNAEASYKNAPFCWSTNGWGVFAHTPAPVTHGVGFAPWSQRSYGVYVEDAHLDLFLFAGETGAEIIRHYTDLTGRAPAPPDWSLGVIISKAYYRDEDELLSTAREIRRRAMPCDTITLDGRAWQDTRTRFSFDWDPARYPEPARVLAELKSMDFRVCVWEYPLVSVNNPLFKELSEKGWLLRDKRTGESYEYEWDAEPFGDVLTPLPNSGIIDFTHPDAYAYWRDRHEALYAIGVDMIKADFGEQVTDETLAHNGERGRALHNVYAFLYNKCVYEAAQKYAANGAFVFSRASWTGCQRFPSQWGGDPQADWEGLAASLRGGLSWGMTGAPFYATDVGGFYGDRRDPKLYVRWLQAAVFSAHMRLHGIGDREPWSYGPTAEAAATQALILRYQLLPYLKQVLRASQETGLPAQRAMALACPDEPEAWSFDEQFFLGEDLLVAPCIRGDDVVRVYLPEGNWRRFPGGEPIEGGRVHRLRLALDEMALFVREGTMLPLGPARRFIEDGADLETPAHRWRASDVRLVHFGDDA